MAFISRGVDSSSKAFKALRFKLLSAIGQEDYRRFLVLSRSRCGSNLLVSLLNSHPDVLAEGEVFARLNGEAPLDMLARAYGKQPFYVKAKGFKLFYYHPLDGEAEDLWEELAGDARIRVIHLKRRNILRTLISRKIAGAQDVWAATSDAQLGRGKPKSTRFTVAELEEGFRKTRAWETGGDRKFQAHPLLSVHYEDLVADPEGCLARILDFLDLPRLPLTSDMRKQNPERLADLVTNYADLKAAFAGTEWQHFFDE